MGSLLEEVRAHSIKIPISCTASKVRVVGGDLDLVLTGTIHLAITALGQRTPAACVAYQGKFEGLFKHFEVSGMTIDPTEISDSKNFLNLLNATMARRKEIKDNLTQKLPHVQRMALMNFQSSQV